MNEKNQEKQSARRKVFFPNDSENRKGGRLSEVNLILKDKSPLDREEGPVGP